MTLVIPPGYAQAAWRFECAGDPEPMITTCGIAVSGFAGDFTAAANEMADNFTDAWPAASINEAWTFIGVVLRVGQDGAPPIIAEAARSVVGTSDTSTLPSNCSYLVKKSSARGGRPGRGRMFVPPFGLPEGEVDPNGAISGAHLAVAQGLIDDWFDPISAFILHDSTAPGGTDPSEVTNMVVDRRIATQRRRMRH
jgi:hypothetical protein